MINIDNVHFQKYKAVHEFKVSLLLELHIEMVVCWKQVS